MSRNGNLKPLRQSRLDDYFPRAAGQHVRRPTGGFASRPELAAHDGKTAIGEELPTKWRTILSLEMRGETKSAIAEVMGMTLSGIIGITHDERYIAYRNRYLEEIDGDFFAMKPLAFDALKNGFASNDENVALKAADMWFKGASFGGYAKNPRESGTTTAEDVAKQLLNINAENVQIINVTPSSEK